MDVPLPAACSPTPPAPSPPAAPAGETVRVQSTYLAYTQNTITLPPARSWAEVAGYTLHGDQLRLVFTDQRTVSFELALPLAEHIAAQQPWTTRFCTAAGVPLPAVPHPDVTPDALPPLLAGWDARALVAFWQRAERDARRVAVELFPSRPPGYVAATRTLRRFALARAGALECRAEGDLAGVAAHLDQCLALYQRLPTYARTLADPARAPSAADRHAARLGARLPQEAPPESPRPPPSAAALAAAAAFGGVSVATLKRIVAASRAAEAAEAAARQPP